MSIQIYNGFVLKEVNTLDSAFSFIKAMRPEFKKEIYKAHAQYVIESAVANHDYDLNFDPANLDILKNYIKKEETSIIKEVMDANKSNEGHPFNFKTKIAIAPFEDKIYGRVFSNNIQAQNIFLSNKGVQEYPFWTITEKPDEISVTEWERRREVWGSIFKEGNSAETEMFRMNIVDHPYFVKYDINFIINHLTDKKRVDNVVKKRSDDLFPPPPPNSTMMEIISHINKYKKSEEFKNNVKHLRENITLKPLIME